MREKVRDIERGGDGRMKINLGFVSEVRWMGVLIV